MKSRIKLILVFFLFLIFSCNRKEDEVCLNSSCPPRSFNDNKCECKCDLNMNNLVNAGNAFCVRKGSFVAYIPQEDHMDTFGLNISREHINTDLVIGHELLLRQEFSPTLGIGFNYKELPSGDSLYIDMLPPMDFAFHFLAPKDNRYGDRQYRLRLEGFIPNGWNDGEIMHATVHFWTLADNPVRPSIEFDMVKVKEGLE